MDGVTLTFDLSNLFVLSVWYFVQRYFFTKLVITVVICGCRSIYTLWFKTPDPC